MKLTLDVVVGGRLYPFADGVGFKRDGYCRVVDDDSGNHSVAATVTQPFLDFTQARGNNLTEAGVKDGMKWCLCAHRWKEAYDAFQQGSLGKDGVPKVNLSSTDKKALDVLQYGDLSKFKSDEAVASHRSRNQGHIEPGSGGSAAVKEHTDLSDYRPKNDNHQGSAAAKKVDVGGGTGTG